MLQVGLGQAAVAGRNAYAERWVRTVLAECLDCS
jgi:hypothetical protein